MANSKNNKEKTILQAMLKKRIEEMEKLQSQSSDKFSDFYSQKLMKPNSILPLVLVGHLYIESILDDITKKQFINPSDLLNYNFLKKLQILNATGVLSVEFYQKLKALNIIRNKYSHNIDFIVSREDIVSLGADKSDLKEWNKDKFSYLTGEIAYICGYLHALENSTKKLRSFSLSIKELKTMLENEYIKKP